MTTETRKYRRLSKKLIELQARFEHEKTIRSHGYLTYEATKLVHKIARIKGKLAVTRRYQ